MYEDLAKQVLGDPIDPPFAVDRNETESLACPGQLAVHYAPRTPTFRIKPGILIYVEERFRYGLLQVGPGSVDPRHEPLARIVLEDPESAAQILYATLHEFDEARLDLILIVLPPLTSEWHAIRDRLTRASRPWEQAGNTFPILRT